MSKLTIAIPTYNRKEAIESIVKKVYTHIIENRFESKIELLVVDNCSTQYNIYEFLSHYRQISFLNIQKNNSNIGAGANFLKCLELANCEYVWLLGDDENLRLDDLPKLLDKLNKSIHFIPSNNVLLEKIDKDTAFCNIDELFNNFYSLESFFILSTYIFKKADVMNYLKIGYESIKYQHPYTSMAIEMINNGLSCELLKLDILQKQENTMATRYEPYTAYVDVIDTIKPHISSKQLKSYLRRDFYPVRKKILYSFNIGIKNKVDLDSLRKNIYRIICHFPNNPRILFLSIRTLLLLLRKNNTITSLFVFIISKIKFNKAFSGKSYEHVYGILKDNIISVNKYARH